MLGIGLTAAVALVGCRASTPNRSDRRIYDLIAERQRASLNEPSDAVVHQEGADLGDRRRMYEFNPHPAPATLPDAFLRPGSGSGTSPEITGTIQAPESADSLNTPTGTSAPTEQGDGRPRPDVVQPVEPGVDAGIEPAGGATRPWVPDMQPEVNVQKDASDPLAEDATGIGEPDGEHTPTLSPSIFSEADAERVRSFGLRETLAYALGNARGFQDAKEELFLAALDLALERHLWTPQFVASVEAEYANYGQVRDFDHAMSAVSEVSLTQRLPFGGSIAARVVNQLMRDLGAQVTTGEPGNVILQADLPLLRGAGRAAFESRYVAERGMIYSVRRFERFRRTFLVEVASGYFDLQQSKAAIANSYQAYFSRHQDWVKADFVNRMGRSRTIFEAPRAKASLRQAEVALVRAKEQYASALDRFKVFIGMPIEMFLDVVAQDADRESQSLDDLLPAVDAADAEAIALQYRLDLLNVLDAVDDAARGIRVAWNQLLPDLTASGSITLDSDPERLNSASYNTERTTWRGSVLFRIDDRRTEQTAHRRSVIEHRRAQRVYDQTADNVRAEVHRALRRINQQDSLRRIQALNVAENETRLAAARAQFDLGKSTNQDVVDAENDLLTARNDLAEAIAGYRVAILEFRRDTGTLRVAEDGSWDASLTPSAPEHRRDPATQRGGPLPSTPSG